MHGNRSGESHTARASVREVGVREAHEAQQGGALLLDVRSHAEYAAGHAPGALLIPLPSLGSRMAEVPGDRPICVICHSGGRSAVAAHRLAAAGFSDVANVRGGMAAWFAAGLPVEAAPRSGGLLGALLSGRLWPRFGR